MSRSGYTNIEIRGALCFPQVDGCLGRALLGWSPGASLAVDAETSTAVAALEVVPGRRRRDAHFFARFG
jgi:hypothetical protein